MAFEQRHERLNLRQHATLLRRREQRDQTTLVERVAAVAHLVDRAHQRLEHTPGIRIDDGEGLVDERQEVALHPGHAGELRPVRDLVDRDPTAEVARPEREALLELEHVGADVIDRVD